METVKVNEVGQITISSDVVSRFGIKKGEEFYVIKHDKGFSLMLSSIDPIDEIRNMSEGIAEKLGLKTEEDVVEYMGNLRKERYLRNADNG